MCAFKEFVQSYGIICLHVISYKGTEATFRALFRRQSLLKVLKRITMGWNTTQCEAVSFFLFIPRLLTKVFRIHVLLVTRHFNSACTFRIRAHGGSVSIARAFSRIHASVAPRVLHFSAFIQFEVDFAFRLGMCVAV